MVISGTASGRFIPSEVFAAEIVTSRSDLWPHKPIDRWYLTGWKSTFLSIFAWTENFSKWLPLFSHSAHQSGTIHKPDVLFSSRLQGKPYLESAPKDWVRISCHFWKMTRDLFLKSDSALEMEGSGFGTNCHGEKWKRGIYKIPMLEKNQKKVKKNERPHWKALES